MEESAMKFFGEILNTNHNETIQLNSKSDDFELNTIESLEELKQLQCHNSLFSESEYRIDNSQYSELDSLFKCDSVNQQMNSTYELEKSLIDISAEQENLYNDYDRNLCNNSNLTGECFELELLC